MAEDKNTKVTITPRTDPATNETIFEAVMWHKYSPTSGKEFIFFVSPDDYVDYLGGRLKTGKFVPIDKPRELTIEELDAFDVLIPGKTSSKDSAAYNIDMSVYDGMSGQQAKEAAFNTYLRLRAAQLRNLTLESELRSFREALTASRDQVNARTIERNLAVAEVDRLRDQIRELEQLRRQIRISRLGLEPYYPDQDEPADLQPRPPTEITKHGGRDLDA